MNSNLQSKPSWLSYYPTDTKNTLDVDYGFDETGMWFYGNVGNGEGSYPVSYPIRTNFDFNKNDITTIVFTFIHGDTDSHSNCSDQGICFFNTGVNPLWDWNDPHSTRIAVQFNCNKMELSGLNQFVSGGEGGMTIGENYTCKVVYNPIDGEVTGYLYNGTSIDGEILDTLSISETLPSGPYRIGFDADKDPEEEGTQKSYFTYLSIESVYGNVGSCSSLECPVPAFKCYVGVTSSCTCAKWKFFTAQCSRIQQSLGICSGTSGAYVPAITVCNQKLL